MSTPTAARLIRLVGRSATRWAASGRQSGPLRSHLSRSTILQTAIQVPRCFSTSIQQRAGLMPESEDPPPPPSSAEESPVLQPTQIDDELYHSHADAYMEAVHEKLEEMQEAREDVEVEYSAGVLSITLPNIGTYIVNKQPPNKQIWLSSPTSGPKRFDWVLGGEGMHEKEGGGEGQWIYLRDGTNMSDLLRKELGITVDLHGHEERMQQKSVDPTE